MSSPGISDWSAARSSLGGGRSSSTMMVMITASTESLKPSRRTEPISRSGCAEDCLCSMNLYRLAYETLRHLVSVRSLGYDVHRPTTVGRDVTMPPLKRKSLFEQWEGMCSRQHVSHVSARYTPGITQECLASLTAKGPERLCDALTSVLLQKVRGVVEQDRD